MGARAGPSVRTVTVAKRHKVSNADLVDIADLVVSSRQQPDPSDASLAGRTRSKVVTDKYVSNPLCIIAKKFSAVPATARSKLGTTLGKCTTVPGPFVKGSQSFRDTLSEQLSKKAQKSAISTFLTKYKVYVGRERPKNLNTNTTAGDILWILGEVVADSPDLKSVCGISTTDFLNEVT